MNDRDLTVCRHDQHVHLLGPNYTKGPALICAHCQTFDRLPTTWHLTDHTRLHLQPPIKTIQPRKPPKNRKIYPQHTPTELPHITPTEFPVGLDNSGG